MAILLSRVLTGSRSRPGPGARRPTELAGDRHAGQELPGAVGAQLRRCRGWPGATSGSVSDGLVNDLGVAVDLGPDQVVGGRHAGGVLQVLCFQGAGEGETVVSSRGVFNSPANERWKLSYKWAKHSHPNKPKNWVVKR